MRCHHKTLTLLLSIPIALGVVVSVRPVFAAKVIDKDMAAMVNDLKKGTGLSPENFNACQITSNSSALPKTDSASIYTPIEIFLYYENNEVVKLTNTQALQGNELDGLKLNCVEYNNYVYLFLDTSNYEAQVKFNLHDLTYIIYSADNGKTWSLLKSMNYVSPKGDLVIPNDRFFETVKFLGNKEHHVISIYNSLDETTYLLDAELNIIKSLAVYNRLSPLEIPQDFIIFNDTIYSIRGSCEKMTNTITCPDITYLEYSSDFGKNWERQSFSYIKSSQFIIRDEKLYHLYLEPCSSHWYNIIPVLDRAPVCGRLMISQNTGKGQWSKAKILSKTANRLLGVYNRPEETPLVVWEDLRFHRGRLCGLIPVVGCIDSGSFEGPNAVYAGALDLANATLKESLIEYNDQSLYIK